ncbi:hypothetical protein RAN53_09640 [Halomonas sp. SSL-5]|uniref:hypothetical protein n=1 Tax=Halomonas sp. SSL-5 TaxID=3065855 RepID=UPI002739C4C5|nr:hypothetical protein [Halomonas sp. SSL-5]MDY7116612.1 hypothetical protein [Halomonas sp. SSL-5]
MSGGGGGDNKVKDTPEQRQLAAVAAEKWNFAQEKLAPLEDAYMESVAEMTDAGRMSYIRGRTMQGQQQAGSELNRQAGQQLQQGGIDPSSGRYQGAMQGLALGNAQAGGETLGRAQFEQDSQQIQGMQNIVAMGQGEATQAQAGLAGLADQAAADARQSSVNQFNRRSANLQLLGQVAGAGTAYGLDGMGGGNAAGGAPTGGFGVGGYAPGQGLDLYGNM